MATVAGCSHITVQVASDGIPADAKAVALNVRAIGPNGPGNLRVVPRWCRSAVRQQGEPPDRHVFGHAPRYQGGRCGPLPMAFVRRDAPLEELDEMLTARASEGMLVAAIAGTPGVGKTALAVQWAHHIKIASRTASWM